MYYARQISDRGVNTLVNYFHFHFGLKGLFPIAYVNNEYAKYRERVTS